VRSIVQEMAGDEPLTEVVVVNQRRAVSILLDGDRAVAELSLDEIEIPGAGDPVKAYELEVEMLPDGTLSDLGTLSKLFTEEYHLAPQPLSKFERALSLVLPNHEPHMSEPVETIVNGRPAMDDGGQQTGRTTQILHPSQAQDLPSIASGEPEGGKQPPNVQATDTMAVAAKKVLRAQFEAMRRNEEGTREGEDLEALHDMRVATRRMRAALKIAGPYLEGKEARRVTDGVRSVTQALGAVRDLDVLIERARDFQAHLPEEQQQDLDGLLSDWAGRRDGARKDMLRLLDSDDYRRFEKRMEAFLEAEEEDRAGEQGDEVLPVEVRHVLASAVWTRYEAVRAYETVMETPRLPQLHMLRITSKYLRYTLEFFREVLPAQSSSLIRDIVSVQDQLGALHDADVAAGLIRDYIAKQSKKGKKKSNQEVQQPPAGLTAYLSYLEGQVEGIKSDFAPIWRRITGPKWRANLATATASV